MVVGLGADFAPMGYDVAAVPSLPIGACVRQHRVVQLPSRGAIPGDAAGVRR